MTRNEILQAASELSECQSKDVEKAKAIAFSLLVEALLCLREIADNTAASSVKVTNEHTFGLGGLSAESAEALRRAAQRVKSTA
jgi:hypothetical protein